MQRRALFYTIICSYAIFLIAWSINRATLPVSEPTKIRAPLFSFPSYSRLNLTEIGIHPKPFQQWILPLPCFEQKGELIEEGPASAGFLYVKVPKTASSTNAGVTLRIATHVAQRHHNFTRRCQCRVMHGTAKQYAFRNASASFLWSMVREPTARALSHTFFVDVSRHNRAPNVTMIRDYQVKYLALHPLSPPLNTILTILKAYDFVGITERLDESLVALQMLLGLDVEDILYLQSTKKQGDLDGGRYNGTCYRIQPVELTADLQTYLQSPEWSRQIYWDRVLYQTVNESLDRTIATLQPLFDRNLARFRSLRHFAQSHCLPGVRLPCTEPGLPPRPDNETDCILADLGCGFECLNEVVRNRSVSP